MNRTAQIKKWAPGVLAVVAGSTLLLGVALTWQTLARSGGDAPGDPGVRIATDPAGLSPTEPAKSRPPTLPALQQGKKRPSTFGLPQYPDAFDFHSMEARSASGQSPIGSSAFLCRKSRADQIAQFYLLALGKEGWEMVWQREAKVHPNNDPHRPPMTGTRLRWLDRTHRKQVTLLALDDPQAKHTAQAVVSWATLPGGRGG